VRAGPKHSSDEGAGSFAAAGRARKVEPQKRLATLDEADRRSRDAGDRATQETPVSARRPGRDSRSMCGATGQGGRFELRSAAGSFGRGVFQDVGPLRGAAIRQFHQATVTRTSLCRAEKRKFDKAELFLA